MAGSADAGMSRSHNEDSHGVDVAAGFAILVDAMGGYNAGAGASEMTRASCRSEAGCIK